MINNKEFIEDSKVAIRSKVVLANYTYTKIGGVAQFFACPDSFDDFIYLIKRAKDYKVQITILGNASNVLVSDDGLLGLVIMTNEFTKIIVNHERIIADAGATLKQVAQRSGEAGLSGFEFACGIPGSVGGAIYMNAGAYGGEMSNIVERVIALDDNNEIKEFTNQDFLFSYRHSLAQDQNLVILQVIFQLEKGSREKIFSKINELNKRRADKQPLEYPSCGSVFRRPAGHFVGPMIQNAGLQGKRIGGAQVSKKHAGFIVNIDHAKAKDYLSLIKLIQDTIYDKEKVKLIPEVRFLGFEDRD